MDVSSFFWRGVGEGFFFFNVAAFPVMSLYTTHGGKRPQAAHASAASGDREVLALAFSAGALSLGALAVARGPASDLDGDVVRKTDLDCFWPDKRDSRLANRMFGSVFFARDSSRMFGSVAGCLVLRDILIGGIF